MPSKFTFESLHPPLKSVDIDKTNPTPNKLFICLFISLIFFITRLDCVHLKAFGDGSGIPSQASLVLHLGRLPVKGMRKRRGKELLQGWRMWVCGAAMLYRVKWLCLFLFCFFLSEEKLLEKVLVNNTLSIEFGFMIKRGEFLYKKNVARKEKYLVIVKAIWWIF